MPLDVDAAAAGTAGELGVLPRRDRDAGFAVELLELLEHDRARRHVHAERQGLRGEHDLEQLALEEVLDHLLEGGQQAGVVRGDPALEALEPLPVAEDGEVLVEERAAVVLRRLADLVALLRRRSADSPERSDVADALVAARRG